MTAMCEEVYLVVDLLSETGVEDALALPIPADQTWFWTPYWQERLTEAEADRLAGNTTVYASEEDFLASLGHA